MEKSRDSRSEDSSSDLTLDGERDVVHDYEERGYTYRSNRRAKKTRWS